jgi:type IV pilus assembly protein PilZ
MASTKPTEKAAGAVKTAKPKVMTVAISDEKALYLSYMPFLANGGVFVPTDATYTVGDPVFLILKLPDNDQQAVPGTVAWITPVGAQSGRTAGVGIHFNSPDGEPIRKRIEALLTGTSNSDRATYSM